MKKRLNIQNATNAMEAAGLTQTAVAEKLSVSREAVSLWLKDKTFPRPNKLLQFAKLLKLGFSELVITEDLNTPVIAFRKKAGTKTKNHHFEKAQETGRFLSHLVPYIPFDTLEMPPVLKSPNCNYEYLQKVAIKVRKDINLNETETVDFDHLIRRFKELQAIIVPVLWGTKNRHENAIHIYLPESQTTWVYLNLDVNLHDFKFWMSHELGHCLSPSLMGDEAEDFADAFAGTLLFPHKKAEKAYNLLIKKDSQKLRLHCLMDIAKEEFVSPDTIQRQVNKYAINEGMSEIDFGEKLYGWITNFNKRYNNLSKVMFDDLNKLSAREYITKTEEVFETAFFDMLRQYLKTKKISSGFIQNVTDMPLMDARSMHSELT